MIRAVLHIIVKKWKQQKCTSIDEWINNIGHVHTMKYHLAIKRKEILIHTKTQGKFENTAAAAAAKSLQSSPTLCDPIDGSPPDSPVPGILQARTLEWVAISFNA